MKESHITEIKPSTMVSENKPINHNEKLQQFPILFDYFSVHFHYVRSLFCFHFSEFTMYFFQGCYCASVEQEPRSGKVF